MHGCIFLYAQEVGLEPTTNRLTVDCSTTELLLNTVFSKDKPLKSTNHSITADQALVKRSTIANMVHFCV